MIDVTPEQKRHKPGQVDPTGAVSSGIQTAPMRGEEGEKPVEGGALEKETEDETDLSREPSER